MVRLCRAPFDNCATALNCWVAPTRRAAGAAGLTVMDCTAATVSVAKPEIPPTAAVIVLLPATPAVANPRLLTVATVVLEEVQVAELVRSMLLPSELCPVAVNCVVVVGAMVVEAGLTLMDARVTGCDEEPPPHPESSKASMSAAKKFRAMVSSPVRFPALSVFYH